MARLRDESARRDPLAGLSAQERKILELIGEGLTNRQIGERMFLAEKTVKNYVSALFAKLGMERRTQAAAYAAISSSPCSSCSSSPSSSAPAEDRPAASPVCEGRATSLALTRETGPRAVSPNLGPALPPGGLMPG